MIGLNYACRRNAYSVPRIPVENPLEKEKVRHVSPILLGWSSEKLEHVAP